MNKRVASIVYVCFFALLLSLHAVEPARGENAAPAQEFKVGVCLSEPFVMQAKGDIYRGFAIDLWELVQAQLGFRSKYFLYANNADLIQATEAGEVDFALNNITVTYERAQKVKFSYPWFDAEISIMTKPRSSYSVLDELIETGALWNYIKITLLLFGITVPMTLLRRRVDPEFPERWHEGLAFCLYDLVQSAKSGIFRQQYLGWIGHLLSVIWMTFGVCVIAYITSSVTTTMTTVSLRSGINSLYDLPGKRVGAFRGSATEAFLRDSMLNPVPFNSMDEAAEALTKDTIDALVEDSPTLEYWLRTNRKSTLMIAGSVGRPQKYAFAGNRKHSELIDTISVELLKIQDSGRFKTLTDAYFGRTGP